MKNTLITIASILIIVFGVIIANRIETTYTLEGRVAGYYRDVTYLEDEKGEVWAVDYIPNLTGKVVITFSTNGTELYREDDRVLSVKSK